MRAQRLSVAARGWAERRTRERGAARRTRGDCGLAEAPCAGREALDRSTAPSARGSAMCRTAPANLPVSWPAPLTRISRVRLGAARRDFSDWAPYDFGCLMRTFFTLKGRFARKRSRDGSSTL